MKCLNIAKSLGTLVIIVALQGCFSHPAPMPQQQPVCPGGSGCPPMPPGTAQFVWEEPMVNSVDVPPGLDPEGIYYRPAHKEIVEVRQGRYKYYQPR